MKISSRKSRNPGNRVWDLKILKKKFEFQIQKVRKSRRFSKYSRDFDKIREIPDFHPRDSGFFYSRDLRFLRFSGILNSCRIRIAGIFNLRFFIIGIFRKTLFFQLKRSQLVKNFPNRGNLSHSKRLQNFMYRVNEKLSQHFYNK